MRIVGLLVFAVLLFGCPVQSGKRTLPTKLVLPATTVSGTLTYESRSVTGSGLSTATTTEAAAFVAVIARSRTDNTIVAHTVTDETGRFALAVPADCDVFARAESTFEAQTLSVSPDPEGNSAHELLAPMELRAASGFQWHLGPSPETPMAGALHIIKVLRRATEAATRWSGRPLPSLFVYWSPGVTSTWSYYRGERPEGSGRYAIELLGGQPGTMRSTDTDEYDTAIILHEFGHFFFDVTSSCSSDGGDHPADALIDPGLAWEEGRASWFATAVMGAPSYQDAIGSSPSGSLRINRNLETSNPPPRGIGSELSVATLLWDLMDGTDGTSDSDADGIALSPTQLIASMTRLRARTDTYVTLGTFIEQLVRDELVDLETLKETLRRTSQPAALADEAEGRRRFADELLSGVMVSSRVDGQTNPAPSGGPARAQNGFDALRVYVVQIRTPGRLLARLEIHGTGRAESHEDLDLELRDVRCELLDSSRGNSSIEAVSRELDVGTYFLFVRDGGAGNRAKFDISVELPATASATAPST